MEQLRTIAQVVRDYRDRLTNSVYETLNGRTDAAGMRRAHRDMIFRLGPDAYVEGLREGGVPVEEIDAADRKAIRDWINEQYAHVNKFADDTVAARGDDGKRKQILSRLDMWVESMRVIGSQGLMSAQKNSMGTWRLGPTELHCKSGNGRIGCANLHGKRHRLSWFLSRGLIPRQPGSAILGCKGYKCLCEIRGDDNSVLVPATDRALRFDPNQPRDPEGKWTNTGASKKSSTKSIKINGRKYRDLTSATENELQEDIDSIHARGHEAAVRFTPNIEGDIERGWSAWMGQRSPDKEEAIRLAVEGRGQDPYEALENRFEQDKSYKSGEWQRFLDDIADEYDVRFDSVSNEWCVVHHDGLSIFGIDSGVYARKYKEPATGQGQLTNGRVSIVGALSKYSSEFAWYLLEVDSIIPEE